MADRSIVVRLRAEISDYQAKIAQASKSTTEFVSKNEQSINTLSNQMGLVGAGLVGVAAVAVKKFAEFDAAMSSVQAATMESATNMGLLRDAAIDAGARTVYSATEAAGAVEELAKAGVSTADILGGGLDGALDLAASGAIAVGDAAEIAATAMTIFGLSGSEVTHIADLLAAGAGKAQGGVGDLGMALKQAGLVASQTGLSIEETVGGLTSFAAAGLVGSDAGTSFKSMLQRLTPQSAEAKRAMDELGIAAYDTNGEFIGLAAFAGNLQNALRDLTPEQRNAAMATIFGSDAVRAANVLYEQGEAGIRDWIAAVDDQGYAAAQAAIRLDNLLGDWEGFTGALDTAFINLGAQADGPLRELVQRATDLVNAFGDAPDVVHTVTMAIAGGGGLILLGLAGLGKMVIAVNETKTAMQALGITAKTASLAVGGIGLALGAATFAITAWADSAARAKARADGLRDTLDDTTGALTRNTKEFIANGLATGTGLMGWGPSVAQSAKTVGLSIADVTDAIIGNADAIAKVKAATEGYTIENGRLKSAAEGAGVSISDYSNAMATVREQIPIWRDDLKAQQAAQLEVNAAVDSGADAQGGLAGALGTSTGEVKSQEAALEGLVDGLLSLANVVLQARDAQRGLEAAYDDATESITENGKTLDITTEKGRANQAALDAIASAGLRVVDTMRQNGASQAELQQSMEGTRAKFVEVAQKMGMTADEANALADKLRLIPSQVDTRVTVNTADASAAIDRFVLNNNGRRIVLNVDTQTGNVLNVPRGGQYVPNADGGLWRFADGGGVDANGAPVRRESMIARGGRNILWAEPETDWEAYISGKPSMRNRNIGILGQVAGRFGLGLVPAPTRFADGGYVQQAQRYATGAASSYSPQVHVAPAAITPGIFDGMVLTLEVDGQPIRAIARTEATDAVRTARSWGAPR